MSPQLARVESGSPVQRSHRVDPRWPILEAYRLNLASSRRAPHHFRMLKVGHKRLILTCLAAGIVAGGLVRMLTDERGVAVSLPVLEGAPAPHTMNALDAALAGRDGGGSLR